MSNKAPYKNTPTGRRRNANAYPSRLIVEEYLDPSRTIAITLERLECGHVIQRPMNKDFQEMPSRTGRRHCRDCYRAEV